MSDVLSGDAKNAKELLQERLHEGVMNVLDSENFKNWLSTGGKLHYNKYSFRNAMLVWSQKPDATYVMGYEAWKEFGRNVEKGKHGARIFIPLMARESYKGGLFKTIKNSLNDQLSKNPSLPVASYSIGSSGTEFTMNRVNGLIGLKVNGQEVQLFRSDDDAKRFIDRAIINKTPIAYSVGTVFDISDVIIPEYLWMKRGFTQEEIARDENGCPIKNRAGETKVINTPERQARFQADLDTTIAAQDPEKMRRLYAALVAVSEKKGVPVIESDKSSDERLAGGVSGYYSRAATEQRPNGYIVIDKDLEITNKCAVTLHEEGHADLHKNLKALADEMGEDRISRSMCEVQAEAVAFAAASTFGIETDTSSFTYLATYANGFEFQDFQKSLEVIYKESQALTADIKAELDHMGLTLDLTEKPKELLDAESLKSLSTKYLDVADEHNANALRALDDLSARVAQADGNADAFDILKYQKLSLDYSKENVDILIDNVEKLNIAATREAQQDAIEELDATIARLAENAEALDSLSEQFLTISENTRGGMTVDFANNPLQALETMKRKFPILDSLTATQLKYLATSKVVAGLAQCLKDDPQEFAIKACERANSLHKVAARNGTFVEICSCEQWTEQPLFEKGTLCSPLIADKIVSGGEAQYRGFKDEARKRGENFPTAKCNITIYSPSRAGALVALNTRLCIGDGTQTSLKDHLEQVCHRGTRREILECFSSALGERAEPHKLISPSVDGDKIQRGTKEAPAEKDGNLTSAAWNKEISSAKERGIQAMPHYTAPRSRDKDLG